jgi:hypothetical protein
MIIFGIVLVLLSLILLKLGFGALKDKANHLEYGVESEQLHTAFCYVYIVGGLISAGCGGWLLAG